MLDRVAAIDDRYEELTRLLSDPDVVNDLGALQRYGREQASLEDVVSTYRALRQSDREIADTEAMLQDGLDEEMQDLAREELRVLRARREGQLRELTVTLLP